jgi:hypothetical protein
LIDRGMSENEAYQYIQRKHATIVPPCAKWRRRFLRCTEDVMTSRCLTTESARFCSNRLTYLDRIQAISVLTVEIS